MKILKSILISLLFIIVLVSCGNKKDKEIKYTLSQNVIIDNYDNYDKEVVIPAHQYVHFSFDKNNNNFVYKMEVYKIFNEQGEKIKWIDLNQTLFYSDIFCEDDENGVNKLIQYNYYDLKSTRFFIDNGSHVIDIYNDSNSNDTYVFSIYKASNEPYEKTFDIESNNKKGANEYKGTIGANDVVSFWIESDNYDFERYDLTIIGDSNIAFFIKDRTGEIILDSKDTDKYRKNELSSGSKEYSISIPGEAGGMNSYYVYIYNPNHTNEDVNISVTCEFGKLYDGIKINDLIRSRFYFYVCPKTGIYSFESDNSNLEMSLYKAGEYGVGKEISTKNNYLYEDQIYLMRVFPDSVEPQSGTINITCTSKQ